MRARRVKGLEPAAPVADNAARIVRVRLDELCGFMPAAADPAAAATLHDMRIAAKRLRYVLELTHPCFGPYAAKAVKVTKELQDVLGEIHDCDVQLPEVEALLAELTVADAAVAGPEPEGLEGVPNRAAYAGLVALQVHLRGRRDALFRSFLERWRDAEREGYRARLEYATAERSQPLHSDPGDGAIMAVQE